jgi:hypothetical protein
MPSERDKARPRGYLLIGAVVGALVCAVPLAHYASYRMPGPLPYYPAIAATIGGTVGCVIGIVVERLKKR